jgi:hypothetical protein
MKFELDIIKLNTGDVITASNEGGTQGGMGKVCPDPELEENTPMA